MCARLPWIARTTDIGRDVNDHIRAVWPNGYQKVGHLYRPDPTTSLPSGDAHSKTVLAAARPAVAGVRFVLGLAHKPSGVRRANPWMGFGVPAPWQEDEYPWDPDAPLRRHPPCDPLGLLAHAPLASLARLACDLRNSYGTGLKGWTEQGRRGTENRAVSFAQYGMSVPLSGTQNPVGAIPWGYRVPPPACTGGSQPSVVWFQRSLKHRRNAR